MKAFRRFVLWAIALFVVLLGLAVAVAIVYEDDVKKELLGQINAQLRCKIEVDQIELTLLERFPRASLKFSNILAYEALPEKVFPDTLLFAENLFLEFSPFDLLGKEYTVKNISLRNAHMNLVIDPNGQANYLFWESSEGQSGETSIEMEKVLLENVQLAFVDSAKDFQTELALTHATISADLDEALQFDINSQFHIALIKSGEDTLALDRAIALNTAFIYSKEAQELKIDRADLTLENIPLHAQGVLSTAVNGQLAINLSGESISIEETRAMMPDALRKKLDPYGLGGSVSFTGKLSGQFSNGHIPILDAEYILSDGKMTELSTKTVFDRIDSKGRLVVHEEQVDLFIHELQARSGPGVARIKGWVKNVKSPKFDLELSAELDLDRVQRFFRLDTLESIKGNIALAATVSGALRDPEHISSKDLRTLSLGGQLTLSDASMKLKGSKQRLDDVNGILMLKDNDAAIQDLRASISGTDVELNGFFRNLLPYVLVNGERLVVEAQFYSQRTDLNGLLEQNSTSAKSEKSYHLELPDNVDLNLNAQMDELVFREFSATNIRGIIKLAGKKLYADPITFSSSGGEVMAKLEVDGRSSQALPLAVNAKIEGIGIDELFRQFEDFGQDFIGSKHLIGTANADVTYRASLQPDLSFDLDKTYSLIDIKIVNGQLIEHAPLVQVAQHIRKNKLVAPFVKVDALEKNLRNVQFSLLENQIEIKDRTVHIPAMMVNTSALNIEMAGTHTFEGYMDHHLNFRLSDLLKTGKTSKDEFGPVVDDGTGSRIYLHMYGNSNNLTIESDRDAIKEDRKEYMAQEKENFKAILKDEFGLFKGQDTPDVKPEDGTSTTFSVSWNDADTLPPPPKNKEAEKKKKGWLNKFLVEDEGEKERFQAEDDDDF